LDESDSPPPRVSLRNRKIVQGREYLDKEQALEAVGLRE
jgi:ketosteroid isomerase-like protein